MCFFVVKNMKTLLILSLILVWMILGNLFDESEEIIHAERGHYDCYDLDAKKSIKMTILGNGTMSVYWDRGPTHYTFVGIDIDLDYLNTIDTTWVDHENRYRTELANYDFRTNKLTVSNADTRVDTLRMDCIKVD